MKCNAHTFPHIVGQIKDSIYVDDIVTGVSDTGEALEFYKKSKHLFQLGGFNLRKFLSNSSEVQHLIVREEQGHSEQGHSEESYTQATLGGSVPVSRGESKVLGVVWSVDRDEVVIDVKHLLMEALALCHTKRNVVSIVSRVYDPLGFIAPAVIPLKIFFKELCESKLGWDEPMTGLLSAKWIRLLEGLRADELDSCINQI